MKISAINGQSGAPAFDAGVEDAGTKDQSSYVGDIQGIQKWVDIQGRLHRVHGPAQTILRTMEKQWYYHGKLNNDNGPAVTRPVGSELAMFWYSNDKLHREDGPAYIRPGADPVTQYFLNGTNFDAEEYWNMVLPDLVKKFEKTTSLAGLAGEYNGLYARLLDNDIAIVNRVMLPAMVDKLNCIATQYVSPDDYMTLSHFPSEVLQSNSVDVQGIVDKLFHNLHEEQAIEILQTLPHEWLYRVKLPADIISMFNQGQSQKPSSIRKFFNTQQPVKIAQSHVSDDAPTRHEKPDGSIVWLDAHAKLHREDGPAIENINGDKEWWIHGKRHRVGAPASEYYGGGATCGATMWFQNGQLHRLDGPAIEDATGKKEWYQYNKRSRTDGPAVIGSDGRQEWYLDGKLHRDGGPAVEDAGDREWYNMGSRHRIDGPAVIKSNGGDEEWWIWNSNINRSGDVQTNLSKIFNKIVTGTPLERLVAFSEQADKIADDIDHKRVNAYFITILVNMLQKVINDIGEDDYRQAGIKLRCLHHKLIDQLNLPIGLIGAMNDAISAPSPVARGTRKFFGANQFIRLSQHRSVDDGEERWTDDSNQLHREDGPAYIREDGTQEWWWHGQLHRSGGPAVEYSDGGKFWHYMGKRHREDGPASEKSNGDKEWYINDYLHRLDGPAVEKSNGDKEWWIDGYRINTLDEYNKSVQYRKEIIDNEENRLRKRLQGIKEHLQFDITYFGHLSATNTVERIYEMINGNGRGADAKAFFDNNELKSLLSQVLNQLPMESVGLLKSWPHEWLSQLSLNPDLAHAINAQIENPEETKLKKFFESSRHLRII